jgi:hypothetical protein
VTEKVTFLFWELTGRLIGGVQYYWKGVKVAGVNSENDRYWYCNDKCHSGLFGLEFFNLSTIDTVFVVEGVWDAIRILSLGYPAVATIGSPNFAIKAKIAGLPCKKIAVLDGDMRTVEIVRYVDDYIVLPPDEDPNSMNPVVLKSLLDEVLDND